MALSSFLVKLGEEVFLLTRFIHFLQIVNQIRDKLNGEVQTLLGETSVQLSGLVLP